HCIFPPVVLFLPRPPPPPPPLPYTTLFRSRRSPPAAGAGPRASYGGPSADLVEGGRPDAGDLQQPVHGGEGAVLLPVLEDPLSDRRAHPGQLLELGGIGGVQVDRGPVGAVGGLCCGVGGAVRERSRLLPRHRDMDLLPVGEGSGEVDRREV